MHSIPLSEVKINDRVRWQYKGDYNWGRVTKINRKTFLVKGEKQEGLYQIGKELVFEVLRD